MAALYVVMPSTDLHKGFRDPRRVAAEELNRFLREADRLPGVEAVHRAMRRRLDLRPGGRLLDAGCGVGIEAARIAGGHPDVSVVGLDRNADLLAVARREPQAANLAWVEGDLVDIDLPDESFDVIRAEKVLMYLAEPELSRALDELVRLLRPGGRLVLFELDYGATMLPQGSDDDEVVQRVQELLDESVPQPRAGRRLPGLLSERGLSDVDAEPFSFAVNEPVWRRIVHDTVGTDEPDVRAWLDEQSQAAARGDFIGAFTGVLTCGRL